MWSLVNNSVECFRIYKYISFAGYIYITLMSKGPEWQFLSLLFNIVLEVLVNIMWQEK